MDCLRITVLASLPQTYSWSPGLGSSSYLKWFLLQSSYSNHLGLRGPSKNYAQIGLFIGYSSQQDCEGILGNGPAPWNALSLESSSLVSGDCNSVAFIFVNLLGTAGAMAITTQHSYLPRNTSLCGLIIWRNRCGNNENNRFPHL